MGDNTEGNMDIGLDLLFGQTLIPDDSQLGMDRQTDDIKGKDYVSLNRPSAAQEANSDAHEVHDVQRIHMIAGTNNTDPTKFSVKFEPTDIDAQEAGPDTHEVHDVQKVNRIRGKLKVYEFSDERTGRRRDREENIIEVKMVNTGRQTTNRQADRM